MPNAKPIPIDKITSKEIHRLSQRINTSWNCWEWTGSLTDGYGRVYWRGRRVLVHRLIYTIVCGDIAVDLELDHRCRNRRCCNPNHLRPCTSYQNWHWGKSPIRLNKDKTHCKYGHEFSEENTYVGPHGRTCKICRRLSDRNRYPKDPNSTRWKDWEVDLISDPNRSYEELQDLLGRSKSSIYHKKMRSS